MKYDALMDLSESLILSLGIVSLIGLRDKQSPTKATKSLEDKLFRTGLTLGAWRNVTATGLEQLLAATTPFDRASENEHITTPGIIELSQCLEHMVSTRNEWAHGARPKTKEAARSMADAFKGTVARCLSLSDFLADIEWILVETCSLRRDGLFDIQAYEVSGDHPEFKLISLTSNQPLLQETMYLHTAANFLDMTPFVISQFCDRCGRRDLFYIDRFKDQDGITYKSFENGHIVQNFEHIELVRSIRPSN